jgi:predicted transcriptional regulator
MGKKIYRSSPEIVAKILEKSRDGIFITRLMNDANLSYNQAARYRDALVDCDYLEMKDNKVRTTEEGREALEALREGSEVIANFKKSLQRL